MMHDPYTQGLADLLAEEEASGAEWFAPEWQALFHALAIWQISLAQECDAIKLWLLRHPQFLGK
ncbi:hypothetical protein [Sulfobacillus thermosulfidooxidans]|uniref:hypothetical protein n=1 Tax=Sulfobacillus thermosulfidooxidans TaxID=28034 RepID=UPI0004256EF3|nr:hypothetical protein [Sulfobacillus thermosulfidooxidans]OLZ11584.1 hypothetical protein BFX05_06185 [Sulfobacillus thermosulfidooxidans]OLZ17426.1 hypothetical protein BFX06_13615 [Sulfobacillus thermosulfidooxidans]OLZ21064.1 hypothetical protein BFX07_13680 [Sulfobacillus thermosulfidooxidans]